MGHNRVQSRANAYRKSGTSRGIARAVTYPPLCSENRWNGELLLERQRFNEAAKAYNQSLRTFPGNIIANMFGFEKRPYFEADEGADKVPETF